MASEGEKRKIQWPKVGRDTVLLLSGVALTVNEAVFREGPERPTLLMLFAGMMGLPIFLRNDEKKQASDKAKVETAQSAQSAQSASTSLPTSAQQPKLERRGIRLKFV